MEKYSETAFVVHIGGQKIELPPHRFLEVCWAGGFDTPCSVCNTQFDVAKTPPVRTIHLHSDLRNVSPFTKTLPPLVILNTHLACLKLSRIKYFPISHAWHEPVADAYASRVSNPAAAKMVFEIPSRILLATVKRFGPDVQIWHDYISIPQWQDRFRGTTILPQIFQIFKHGDCSIIHLDDQPGIQTSEAYAPEEFVAQSSSLQRLFTARWFNRMWIVIEYDVCRDAYLLNSNYDFMPDTFSSLMRQIADCQVGCLDNNLIHSASSVGSASKWIDTVPMFLKERMKNKCLGHIYDMISDQGCRSYHDRFIASCALLEVNNLSHNLSELPQDPQEACLWVSKRCLEGNDLSPLLLRPSDEPRYDKAHWLKGHKVMTSNMWGLAIQTRAAHVAPRVEGNSVSLELDLMGTVMNCFSWKARGLSNQFGFAEVLPKVVESAAGSASEFLGSLERIYPSEIFWVQRENTYDFPGLRYRVPSLGDIENEFQNLLQQYSEADRRGDSLKCRIFCDEVISTLALSEPPSSGFGPFGTVSRLQLYALLCVSTEYTLLLVQCETCGRTTPYRATLWREHKSHVQLYRIPGLAYRASVPEGMGIVVENQQIIGRTRFGFPACNCNPKTLVQLS